MFAIYHFLEKKTVDKKLNMYIRRTTEIIEISRSKVIYSDSIVYTYIHIIIQIEGYIEHVSNVNFVIDSDKINNFKNFENQLKILEKFVHQ